MEDSVQNIMNIGYKYRLEFDFNGYFINIQPTDGHTASIYTNYPQLLKEFGSTIYLDKPRNGVDFIILFDSLPKYRWDRIKLKFYGTNVGSDEVDEIRKLIKDFNNNCDLLLKDRVDFNWM